MLSGIRGSPASLGKILRLSRGIHSSQVSKNFSPNYSKVNVTGATIKPLSTINGVAGSNSPVTDKKLPGYANTLKQKLGGGVLTSNENYEIAKKDTNEIDWYNSWHGIGSKPFPEEIQAELSKELDANSIEIKPDGLIYLPEIKYRRILNKAFGAGGWGLVPRSDTIVTAKLVTREYALVCHGQLVSIARGEQDYFSETGIPTATEGCKSNALMRCCKDLGIGSELWDPVFIKKYKKEHCVEKFVEHVTTQKKKKIWLRKGRLVEYPYK